MQSNDKRVLTDEEIKKIKQEEMKDMGVIKKPTSYTITDDLMRKK